MPTMKLHNMLPFRYTSIGLALLSISAVAFADDLAQTYCSTQNTGSDFSAVYSIYQSNGKCHDTCNAQNYAFAIVQYQNCWCSNYIPASQDDTSNCSQNCPGYPDEQCGNQDGGYYGYIALGASPSGTAGAVGGSASQTSASEPSSTEEPSSTGDPATSYTPTPTPSTSSKKSSSSVKSSTSEPTTSEMPATPVTSVIMTTISGAIVTQTVTTTPVVAPGSHSDQIPLEQQDHGLGSGAIAGIVIGVLAGIALLAAIAFFLWRRKRNDDGDAENSNAGSKKSMTRNVSVLSKAGLLARTRPSMGERDHDDSYYVTPATGQNSVRHSMLFAGAEGVSPTSPLDSSHSNDSGKSARVYDQRLNPSALFANHENGSRISMQDQQDYSRPLGVTNPDPRASFDSRLSRGG